MPGAHAANAAIIFNPAAGRRRRSRLDAAIGYFRAAGCTVDLFETEAPGHATELARDLRCRRLVIAAGGDGTIAEIAAGLLGSDCVLGILPLGTANVIAREHGVPSCPRGAAARILAFSPRLLWPGIARRDGETRPVLQMLGAGFDARVVHAVRPGFKRVAGRAAYVAMTLRQIAIDRAEPITLSIDGDRIEAANAIISKGRLYGGGFLLAPDANAGKPGFTVTIAKRDGVWPRLCQAAMLPLNRLHRSPGIHQFRATHIGVETSVTLHADGDVWGSGPVWIGCMNRPLKAL